MIPNGVCWICYGPLLERARRTCYSDRCTERYNRENRNLGSARNVSRSKYNLEGTLFIEQWLETLHYFNWMCAYCQVRPYEHMDHFISWQFGGGTTPGNCVPACNVCNSYKGPHYFDRLPKYPTRKISEEAVERVCAYLLTCTRQ